jgi:hypothetical protein
VACPFLVGAALLNPPPAHPAAPAGARLIVAAPLPDGEPPEPDLSWLYDYAAGMIDLAKYAIGGVSIFLFTLVITSGAAFVGLAKTGDQKRRWAIATGVAFGLICQLRQLALQPYAQPAALVLALPEAVVQGLTAGILAAFAYHLVVGRDKDKETP